jgi:hypothetical protein
MTAELEDIQGLKGLSTLARRIKLADILYNTEKRLTNVKLAAAFGVSESTISMDRDHVDFYNAWNTLDKGRSVRVNTKVWKLAELILDEGITAIEHEPDVNGFANAEKPHLIIDSIMKDRGSRIDRATKILAAMMEKSDPGESGTTADKYQRIQDIVNGKNSDKTE